MSGNESDFSSFLSAAIVNDGALWLAVNAAQNNEDRRQTFVENLQWGLEAHGLVYVVATFGRDRNNIPVWIVSYRVPPASDLKQKIVRLDDQDEGATPYGDAAVDRVVKVIAA